MLENELTQSVLNVGRYFQDLYLDYVNNFLTIECFANYHGFDTDTALKYINIGKKIHNTKVNLENIYQHLKHFVLIHFLTL